MIYLSKKDRVLKSIILTYPNEYLSINNNYFHCFINSIIGQQISVSAATSIKKRFFSIDDGLNQFKIFDYNKDYIIGISKESFELKSNKGLNIPESIYNETKQFNKYSTFLRKAKKVHF